MKKNNDGTWFLFNRDYLPLGWKKQGFVKSIEAEKPFQEIPANIEYHGFTDEDISEIIDNDNIEWVDGSIHLVYFYGEKNDPLVNVENWVTYFDLLAQICRLNTDSDKD